MPKKKAQSTIPTTYRVCKPKGPSLKGSRNIGNKENITPRSDGIKSNANQGPSNQQLFPIFGNIQPKKYDRKMNDVGGGISVKNQNSTDNGTNKPSSSKTSPNEKDLENISNDIRLDENKQFTNDTSHFKDPEHWSVGYLIAKSIRVEPFTGPTLNMPSGPFMFAKPADPPRKSAFDQTYSSPLKSVKRNKYVWFTGISSASSAKDVNASVSEVSHASSNNSPSSLDIKVKVESSDDKTFASKSELEIDYDKEIEESVSALFADNEEF